MKISTNIKSSQKLQVQTKESDIISTRKNKDNKILFSATT
ncbi:3630_t:CDS:2 [Cetraspora pellucida]|uniref:3630_t:CDS:1 n=1 Tax=Cetraspora pellucida TaxID=1433469 RepID=A0A9N8WDZ6_9GLOM|nr:3630_t:CDS:2 [Cetraspora pellucida]